jgi:hypothetical protein
VNSFAQFHTGTNRGHITDGEAFRENEIDKTVLPGLASLPHRPRRSQTLDGSAKTKVGVVKHWMDLQFVSARVRLQNKRATKASKQLGRPG